MKKEIITHIDIQASPEAVWKVLSDFAAYPNWNPFIFSLTGEVAPQKRIEIHLKGGMKFKPVILEFSQNKALRWAGSLWFKGLFDGEHCFIIEKNDRGGVTFTHSEYFSGILVGLMRKKLDGEIKESFIEMNQKLKERVEKGL